VRAYVEAKSLDVDVVEARKRESEGWMDGWREGGREGERERGRKGRGR
jgi:hypothetical protein